MPVEVCSEIAVLAPSAKLLISIARIVDVEFRSSASRTKLVRKIIHYSYSPNAFRLLK
jgi:hypothetical protein